MVDSIFAKIFPSATSKKTTTATAQKLPDNPLLADKELGEQVKYILTVPDDQYDEKKLTSKLRQYILEVEKHYSTTIHDYKSHIAPAYWEVKGSGYNIS